MNPEWQSWMVAAVVAVTVVIFAARLLRKKKSGACSSCGCGSGKDVARQAPDPRVIVDKAHQ
jgi:hypothetical protein